MTLTSNQFLNYLELICSNYYIAIYNKANFYIVEGGLFLLQLFS